MKNTTQALYKIGRVCAGFLLALLAMIQTHAAATNSTSEITATLSNEQQMLALKKEVDDAEAAYMSAGGKGESETNLQKLWKAYTQLNQTNLPKIFELAQQEPQTDTSFEMFKWIVINRQIQMAQLYTNAVQSLEYLRKYHTTNPDVARICRALRNNWDPSCQPAIDFLEVVADKNPDRDARGSAVLALARFKKVEAENLEFFLNAPPASARFEKSRTNYLAMEKNQSPASISREAETLFHKVLNQYADCSSLAPTNSGQSKTTLGQIAKSDLYELEHLSVGDIAPDIAGKGVNGEELKLSNYRGKVVVLTFWASWCGPCMQMVPSEVRLAERMKGKPFALVGVDGDVMLDGAKKAMEQNKMTWPSFFDKGPDGPIPTAWNVSGWPTVFILDGKGVIRFKLVGYGLDTEKFLDGKVDQLLSQSADNTHG